MYNSITLIIVTMLYHHHHCPFPKLFITPNINPAPSKQQFLIPSFPQPLITSHLLYFSKNLPILDTSYPKNHLCPCVWLISLCITFLRFNHLVANVRISFFLWENNIPLSEYTILSLFIHLLDSNGVFLLFGYSE